MKYIFFKKLQLLFNYYKNLFINKYINKIIHMISIDKILKYFSMQFFIAAPYFLIKNEIKKNLADLLSVDANINSENGILNAPALIVINL